MTNFNTKCERNNAIRALRADGATFDVIGKQFNITPERARQIAGDIKRPRKPKLSKSAKKYRSNNALPLLCKNTCCTRKAIARGWCNKCYHNWLYHNSATYKQVVAEAKKRWVESIYANREKDPVKYERYKANIASNLSRYYARRKAKLLEKKI